MSKLSRILVAAASLALLLLFVFPLWRIRLEAPQYPEGLGMHISVHAITGEEPHDLQNINQLNHYVGMKPIRAEGFPELRWMPWIVGFLALTGLATAAAGRRSLLYAWAALFLAFAVVGMFDFWRWEQAYGHELDPLAIIKIPGMSYDPPLLGRKTLLNFTATSLPALGGWIAIAAGAIAAATALRELVSRRPREA